jgi:hypothetical protein
MELRCSEDYVVFISQPVIEAYLRLFTEKMRQKSDGNELDFTDYEVQSMDPSSDVRSSLMATIVCFLVQKTVFKEIFHLFIGHYRQRAHNDAPWFLPLKENLANIQSIFE